MITKHIKKQAEKIAKLELKNYLERYKPFKDDYEKANTPENKERVYNDYLTYYAAELTRIKNALINGRFYAGVVHVSRSGMSRDIKLAYIHKNKLRTIRDKNILALAGVSYVSSGIGRIVGCGMDMLFHAQYTLFNNLHRSYKEAHYQKRMANYNNL